MALGGCPHSSGCPHLLDSPQHPLQKRILSDGRQFHLQLSNRFPNISHHYHPEHHLHTWQYLLHCRLSHLRSYPCLQKTQHHCLHLLYSRQCLSYSRGKTGLSRPTPVFLQFTNRQSRMDVSSQLWISKWAQLDLSPTL